LVCSSEAFSRDGVIHREIKDAVNRCRNTPLGHICLVPVRIEEISLPDELSDYHYVDFFRPDWQFQLARSLDLKFQQSNLQPPGALTEFIRVLENAGGIALKTLKNSDASFEAEANYLCIKKRVCFGASLIPKSHLSFSEGF